VIALANLALSPCKEIIQVFECRGLLDKVMKMLSQNHSNSQIGVNTLVRNLTYYEALRPSLLERDLVSVLGKLKGTKQTLAPTKEIISESIAQMQADSSPSPLAEERQGGPRSPRNADRTANLMMRVCLICKMLCMNASMNLSYMYVHMSQYVCF
jgi:hypothetical protein